MTNLIYLVIIEELGGSPKFKGRLLKACLGEKIYRREHQKNGGTFSVPYWLFYLYWQHSLARAISATTSLNLNITRFPSSKAILIEFMTISSICE